MSELIESEKEFWNSEKVVKLFSDREPSEYLQEQLEKLKFSEDFKTLDHGCGGGRNSLLLADKNADLYCIDANPAMVDQTRESIKSYYVEEISDRVKRAHIVNLPFEDHNFELIVSMGVLHQAHNLGDFERAINEITRVLENEGIIILEIFTDKSVSSDVEIIKNQDGALVVKTSKDLPMTLLSENKFIEIMEDAGFKLLDSKSVVKELETGERSILSATFKKGGRK